MKLSRAPLTDPAPPKVNPAQPVQDADPLALGAPMPKSLGRRADLYHDVRELRLLMEKECAAIKARESEIKESIIREMPKGDTGASGLRYRAQITTTTKPQVSDDKGGWPAVWAFIKKTDRFDLLQKRLGEKAIADMWENGEEIPGVAKVHVPDVSITKI